MITKFQIRKQSTTISETEYLELEIAIKNISSKLNTPQNESYKFVCSNPKKREK